LLIAFEEKKTQNIRLCLPREMTYHHVEQLVEELLDRYIQMVIHERLLDCPEYQL
jgi:hypothetical protein